MTVVHGCAAPVLSSRSVMVRIGRPARIGQGERLGGTASEGLQERGHAVVVVGAGDVGGDGHQVGVRVGHRHRPAARPRGPTRRRRCRWACHRRRRRPRARRRAAAATFARPDALVTPAAEISASASLEECVTVARPPMTSSTSATNSSGPSSSWRASSLAAGDGDHLLERRLGDPGGVDVPAGPVDRLVAELEPVLDGEPGAGLPPPQLGGDRLEELGLQRVLVEHLEATPGRAAPRRCSRPPSRAAARRGCARIQRGGRPVASTIGTPSARQRSSSATVAVADGVVRSAAGCRPCRWRSAAASSQTSPRTASR